jgi:tetratricopeptide (TPR) repeat protein/2-polyprenyl-3-methyl-5-hydroxy-6-metoxy-1,4-benzoquinol methylase
VNETITNRQNMADLDTARVSPAIAAIDEGNALEEQGRIAEALALYEAAVRADPQCARAHLNRGNILLARGVVGEARSAYERAITCDPAYAGAHFNLGNLLTRAGDFAHALPHYQTAVDLRPDFADAFVALGNAFDGLGLAAEAAQSYERALAINPGYAEVHLNLGLLAAAQGRSDEAVKCIRRAIGIRPDYAAAHYHLGVALFGLGRYSEAADCFRAGLALDDALSEALGGLGDALLRLGNLEESVDSYRRLLLRSPDSALTHYKLAAALLALGRIDESIESFREAVRLQPTMHQAHCDLAAALMRVRPNPRLGDAASSLRRAIEINPDVARAHHMLGAVLTNLRQFDAAEASFRRAWSIEPESQAILYDLAMALMVLGKPEEALQLIVPMLDRAPLSTIKSAFAACIARIRITKDDSRLRAALTTAIAEAWAFPHQLCPRALQLVLLDPRIGHCVRFANGSWPARLPKAAMFGASGLSALAADALLQVVLETAPVTTIEFERFLTCARHALLETASSNRAADSSDIAALPFYAALARQCFVNEYIFDCDEREKLAAAACRTQLLALLDAGAAVPPLILLAVAAYFPLHTLPNASRLLAAEQSGPIDGILRQQIREPLEEQALRAGIERLTPISGGVSEEVRDLYEQNPYPRWVRLPIAEQALRFNEELRQSLPFGQFTPLPDDSAPEALIAGCGTGRHSIITAQRFHGVRVLAIDLSLSSICYAKRKTQEHGTTNIEYGQADILKLGDLGRTFDLVESVGVLHHLADPFAGWRTLLTRLRPGGFMRLGFYSEIARRNVVKGRAFIASHGFAGTPDDIRRFRQDSAVSKPGAELYTLTQIPDFYSTSDCRDMLFHVQEHRLTLAQIASFLAEAGLHFIGFELEPEVLNRYDEQFADDPSGTNLHNWALFEERNPDTFLGMYLFWIQKPSNHRG